MVFSLCFFSLCNKQIRDSFLLLACVLPQHLIGHPILVFVAAALQTWALLLHPQHSWEAATCPPSPGRCQPFLCLKSFKGFSTLVCVFFSKIEELYHATD